MMKVVVIMKAYFDGFLFYFLADFSYR